MKQYCVICNLLVEDIAYTVLKGCIKCGSKKIAKRHKDDYKNNTNNLNEDISIAIKGQGEYFVNIQNLVNRTANDEPLVIADKDGKINFLYSPK